MNLKKFNDDAISIQAFLSKYLGVCVENKRLTHEQVKHLFPDIERSSFEDIIKNPELIYTGVVILVKDFKGELIPYYNYHKNLDNKEDIELDSREKLVVELVTRINNIVSKLNESLIILENNDSISNNCIELVRSNELTSNNQGGILVNNKKDIYTFKYLLNKILDYSNMCYSMNKINASELSKKKDIISINITNKGRVYITFNGKTNEKMNLIDIRNFLLKNYQPREDKIEEVIEYDFESLEIYELEKLFKKIHKGDLLYNQLKQAHRKKREEKREDLSEYRKKIRKLEKKWED